MLVTTEGRPLQLVDEPPLVGGEALVYGAVDADGRRTAVKVAKSAAPAGSWLDRERTLLEELGSGGLDVVEVLGHGQWEGRPFLVMPWYDGTLEALVARRPALAVRLRVAREVARAVVRLHAAAPGLVHCDLKPSNILLDADRVILTDFGVAQGPRVDPTAPTRSFTPGWCPPEQALPGAWSPCPSWDVYSLAATVFFTLTGRPPRATLHNARCLTAQGQRALGGVHVAGATPDDLLDHARMIPLTPADEADLRRLVDAPLIEALRAALAPRRDRRPRSASALATALAAARPARRPRRVPGGWTALAAVFLTAASASGSGPTYPMVPLAGAAPTASFLVGTREVDQRLWREVLGEDPVREHRILDRGGLGGPCDHRGPVSLVGDDLPVVCVDWYDAIRFANALSVRDGLEPAYVVTNRRGAPPAVTWRRDARGYRLPTRAEREAATGAHGSAPGIHDVGDVSEWLWDGVGAQRAVAVGPWSARAGADGPALDDTARSPAVGLRLARSPR